MRAGIDYHIHTLYQKCGNATLTVPAIIQRAKERHLTSIAITDHLNSLDMLDNFRLIKRDIEQVETDLEVWFGAELNFMGCDGEWPYSAAIRDEYGFQVAIGGIHSAYTDTQDPVELIDLQHRHHMRTLTDPLVDVLVHPYWFGDGDISQRSDAWWDRLMEEFPDDRITELAQASAAHGTAIEVNCAAIFYCPRYSNRFKAAYIEFLRRLAARGALFTTASDAHDINELGISTYAEGVLDGIGVPETQIWRPGTGSRG
jgi:histidinol phosphatase-like PHP family hydrolase